MELHDLTALEQAAAIRAREVSPVELVEHYLARIETHDAELGAFVTVTAEAAREAAKVAELTVRDASDPAELAPLIGVPTALKDLAPTAGVRTTFGSAVFEDFVPVFDADVVTLLRAAGTISLGKTATSEFGVSLYTEPVGRPPTRNPWRRDLIPGGSSGGAAAAVAAGLVPVAHGSDGGGSLRIPASLCGLVGYKPTRGLVSSGPLSSGMFGLPTHGPIGRTVADVAALLDAMAVPMPGEPFPFPAVQLPLLDAARRADPGRPLRVGRHATPMLADGTVDDACLAAWERATALLEELGHTVDDIEPPFDPSVAPLFLTVWSVLPGVPPGMADRVEPITRWLLGQAAHTSAAELHAVLGALQALVRSAMRELVDYDLLLTPVLAAPSAEIGSFRALEPADDFLAQGRFSPFCAPYNLTGQPAISLPLGATSEGLPVGIMLAARVNEDALLFSAAAQLEAASPWRHLHPSTW